MKKVEMERVLRCADVSELVEAVEARVTES
jgi:hypothetical protein